MSVRVSESKRKELVEPQTEESNVRVPLKDVVADCERRWFEAALKAAKTGDAAMQNLVGHMFSSGYGVATDKKKGKLWLQKSADAGDEEGRVSLSQLSVIDSGISSPHSPRSAKSKSKRV